MHVTSDQYQHDMNTGCGHIADIVWARDAYITCPIITISLSLTLSCTHARTHTHTHAHTHVHTVSGQLQVSSTGEANPRPFSNPDRITVGFASDLIVQVQCTSQNSSSNDNIQWSYFVNDSLVDTGLRAFGTSQEDGMLRVYPASLLTGNGSMFQCSDGELTLNVTFDLRKSVKHACKHQ